jgi:hypothetical protein
MNSFIWILFVAIDVLCIIKFNFYNNFYFWLTLFATGISGFIEELGERGKGEYSIYIRYVGFVMLFVTLILAFIILGPGFNL